MRVVAGEAGGRRLRAPSGTGTRPTTDRVREAIFNALASLDALDGATVLDGYAGSGALGIEALSRGAARATFVECDRTARGVVEANLASTGLVGRAEVVAGDVAAHLARTTETYDLVLLDPPHASDEWAELLAAVARRAAPAALVVVESDRPVLGQVEAPSWGVIREKRYGGTVVQMARHLPSRGDS